ncbi:fimbrial protein [Escherichia coli]|uniref:fimbrial protein n=1 Tax=Escherichia coli TaxID=562 RepID=UPI0017BD85B5|nr:fimbrial protein [Escherichia coli]EFA5076163.1 fimbrial protein [Escherichia coli]
MSLRVWMVAGGMMLMCITPVCDADYMEKSTTINFSVNVREPVCQIEVPASVDFGAPDVSQIRGGSVARNFTITLKNCTQQIPKPKIIFEGNLISDDGMYIKNKSDATDEYASGVGIRLKYGDDEVNINNGISLGGAEANNSNVYYFTAHLEKEGNKNITAGKVDASVTVRVTYN